MRFSEAVSCGVQDGGGYAGRDVGFVWYHHSFHCFSQLVDFVLFMEAVVAKFLNGCVLLDTVRSACFAVGLHDVILVVDGEINNKSGLGFLSNGSSHFYQPVWRSLKE